MLGSRDRAEQQRARFEAAEVVPVALLGGVDREQVHGAGHDQPQHVRPFEVQAGEAGAVDRGAHAAERAEHVVALGGGLLGLLVRLILLVLVLLVLRVRGRHLIAP